MHLASIVVGSVKLRGRRGQAPAVRTHDILDGAAGRAGRVERNPAGAQLGRHDPLLVAVVLVKGERAGARRLPEQIVLVDPRARPTAEPRAPQADAGIKDRTRHVTVRLPRIADLARQVFGVPPFAPVPLVGAQAGLELAAEERSEPRGQTGGSPRLDESFDDEEAVPAKALNIRRTRLVDQEHGSARTPAHRASRIPGAGRSFSRQTSAFRAGLARSGPRRSTATAACLEEQDRHGHAGSHVGFNLLAP